MLVKALTHSDCSYFEEYHRRTGMKQKAINLDQSKMKALFPRLAGATNTASYRVRVDVFVRDDSAIVDEQAITLSQKNWRLNGLLPGELVVEPGDVLLCQILGDDAPSSARVPAGVALTVVKQGDQGFDWLTSKCPGSGFANLDDDELLDAQSWDPHGPIWRMIDFLTEGLAELVADVLDVGENASIPRIGLRSIERTGTTREAVEKLARVRAAIGLGGETLVDALLERKCDAGEFESYKWVAARNATASVDFRAVASHRSLGIEVKTTTGPHAKKFAISIAELREARAAAAYEIWRVSTFNVQEEELRGSIRRSDPRQLAVSALQWLDTSPEGVGVSSVDFVPTALEWSQAEKASCSLSRVPSDNWLQEMDVEAG